jgi:uncharacterized lipoprotein YmbA
MRMPAKLSACAAALSIAGCGGKVVRPHYYTLETPPALSTEVNGRQLAGTIAVDHFDAPAYLRQGRIVYRPSPQEIGFYEYRRWAVDPAQTTTAAVINALRSRRLFSIVKRYDGRNDQDYLLTGRLERLEELDYDGPVRVKAEISGELVNLRTGSAVWTGTASAMFNVEMRNVDSVVEQMNHAVQDCVGQLAASLDQRLTAKQPGAE